MTQPKLDPTSDKPLSRQLADLLRDEIRSGVRSPGSQLPTEAGFQANYGVSRTTVRNALSELVSEGLVVTRKGYGSYVRDSRAVRRVSAGHSAHRSSGRPVFDTIVESQGHRASRRMLEVGRTPLPEELAEWLEVEPATEVVIRRRLQLIDDEPAVIATSYYPLWLAEGTALEGTDPILPQGPDSYIEALGHVFTRWVEVLKARMPLRDEARLLTLDPGIAVVRVIRADYDQSGRPLQVADDLYPADRYEFVSASDNGGQSDD